MGITILGTHNMVRFGTLRIWAERGLIHMEDEVDNSYKVENVRTMLMRVKAINDMIGNSSDRGHSAKEDKGNYAEERLRLTKFVEDMIPLLRKAQEQGTPGEAMKAGQRPKNARPVQVVFGDDIPTFQI